jgi:pimeloyl-ACP methyl ester carboxylesterase
MNDMVINISINHKNYSFYKIGNGKLNIILLHSLGVNKDNWLREVNKFRRLGVCYLIDLPGHNGLPMYDIFNIKQMSEYIQYFINYYNLDNVVLIGFSLGGIVAIELANLLNDSNSIKGIVIWSSPLLGISKGLSIKVRLLFNLLKLIPSYIYDLFKNPVILHLGSTILGIHLSLKEAQAFSKISKENIVNCFDMMDKWKFSMLNQCPKLFIFSPDDSIVKKNNYEFLSTPPLLIKGGGHFGSKTGWGQAIDQQLKFISEL